jgi:superfamily II DNA or RNA helicase
MPTGTGKTKTTNHIVISDYIFNKKNKGILLWLAHTKELLQQAYGTFYSTWSVLGNQTINAAMNEIDYVPKDNTIIFMSYQKLISLRKNKPNMLEQLVKNVVGIVADEAHKCLARETGYAIESLMGCRPGDNNKYLIGLSATPGRKV